MEVRALLLEDWAKTVLPENAAGQAYIEHSVTYGSGALQASYIINGGALAALPAIVTTLTDVSAIRIALTAIPFVAGIIATATASLAAYLNFQYVAAISFIDGATAADNIASFYHRQPKAPTTKDKRDKFERWRDRTFYIGVGAGIMGLLCFVVGAIMFLTLAASAKSHQAIPLYGTECSDGCN